MPKQINVKLGFQADTAQAKKQIQDLQNSLDNLMSGSIKGGITNGFDQQISNAQQSVLKLKTALNNSLNADTGRLDLSKFNQQLNNSDLSLSKLAKDMSAMGADGQKAFLNLANSIVTAQKPMVESNKLLDSMWTALKNTARWQLSSSILHGFMGALQGAYGYARDLDKSLNSIRIVTGQSADQMAVLAENANKSAQALSTSTLAYTDAALIYYQQGLGDEEVQKRVETTLKMSNVTGESAEQVSSYMTAIWNNFAEGSDNLELFADKITALGAATASSSEEIANGLNQFAALGSSLGLTYDDATAALATVVAQTRQSAATVGNSFRTLFQRIESLKLGETLEDGVDLTKYSEALSKVGVQILDANGDLRDMHDVIMDLGFAWEGLSKAQKNALAQTVGGVRNSNTLIAWMDNFDKFQDNLGVVANAEGTLQEQADIYAESWEAARKRVQAAWQALYQDLIDEDVFIGILNSIEKVLNGVDKLIDSLGGLPGVLSSIGVLATSVFGKQMTASLQNAQLQLSKVLKPKDSNSTYAELAADKLVDDTLAQVKKSREEILHLHGQETVENDIIISNLEDQIALNKQLRDLRGSISDEEFELHNNLIKTTAQYAQQVEEAQKLVSAQAKKSWESSSIVSSKLYDFQNEGTSKNQEIISDTFSRLLSGQDERIADIAKQSDWSVIGGMLNDYINDLKEYSRELGLTDEQLKRFLASLVELKQARTFRDNSIVASEEATKIEQVKLAVETLNKAETENKDVSEERKRLVEEISKVTEENITKHEDSIASLKEESQVLTEEIEKLKERLALTKEENKANKIFSDKGFAARKKMQADRLQSQVDEKQMYLDKARIAKEAGNLEEFDENWEAAQKIKVTQDQVNEAFKEWLRLTEDIFQRENAIKDVEDALKQKQDELNGKTEERKQFEEELQEKKEKQLAVEKAITEEQERQKNENNSPQPKEPGNNNTLPWYLDPEKTQGIVGMAQGIMQLSMSLNALKSAWETLQNDDLGALEKFTSVIPSLAMAIPGVVGGITALGQAFVKLQIGTKLAATETVTFGTALAATPVGWITAAIVALSAAFWALDAAIYTAEERLEDEKKKLEEQAEKAKEAEESYNKLASAIDSYEEASQKLDNQGSLMSEKEKNDLVRDTNAQIYEALKNSKNWKNIVGEIKYDNNGLIEITDEQLKQLDNEQNRLRLLEQQKETLQEIKTLEAQGDVNTSNYTGPRLYKDASAQSDQYAARDGLEVKGEDITSKLWTALANNGISDASMLLDSSASDISNILKDFTEREHEKAISFIKNLSETELEKFNEEISNFVDGVSKIEIEKEQWINDILSNTENFSDYDEDSQNTLRETVGSILDNGQEEDFLKYLYEDAMSLEEALHAVGVETDNLNLKFKELSESGHNIRTNVNADDLNNYKGKTKDLAEEVAKFGDYLKNNATKIEELSDHLADCASEANKVAYSLVRFDDAMQDVAANYKDWKETLNSEDLYAINKAVQTLRKTYGNLLDMDGSKFSEDFLQSADNLDLLNKVLTGTKEEAAAAYNELERLGQISQMQIQLGVSEEQATAIVDNIRGLVDNIEQELGRPLRVGESIDDSALISALNNIINMCAATETQAEEILSGLGFDAEVERIPVDESEVQQMMDLTPTVIPNAATMGVPVAAQSETEPIKINDVPVPGLKYNAEKKVETGKSTKEYTALKIKSLHKSTGGNFKINNSPARASALKPSSGSGGKKGGGGSGSTKKKEVKEHVKNEDRYHDIKERIDDLNKATDRLGKTKDRVYGKSKLKYINDEIEALEKQVKLTDEYIAEIKKYLALDLGNLKGIGMGAIFDENDMLTNYEQVLANITATYNKAIDEYNASAQEETDKEILEKAQKTYEENKKILKQYEDTYNLLQEQIDNRIDQINAIYDAKLEKIDWQVKLQLDFDDKDRELLEWIFDNMGDGADRAADRIANLNEQMETFDQDWETYRRGIKEIFSNHGIDLDFDNLNSDQLVLQLQEFMRNEQLASELTEKEAEQLRDYLSGLMTTYTSMKETADEVHEILSDAIDAMAEEFEKQSEKIEQAGNIMKHYASIVDLTGRKLLKLSSSELRKMSQQIVKNAQDALGAAKAQMEDWRDQMAEAQQLMLKYQLEGDEQSYKYWKEHFEQLEELYTDATENYYSAWEEALEAANDAFEKSIDLMKEDYENAFGDMDLTWMAEQFETQQELNELYLPDYKKYHELNASVRKLNKSLQDTNNTLIKGKMNDLLDEINAKMAAGVEISEYEAGIIERRIALLQAEAQLRDAQQAKSAVRMTRDNEGNFSYTYTADQDAIGDAQENYAEAVYDYQDYMVSMSNDLQSKWLEWNQYFAECEAEILAKYKEGTEEYNQAMAALAEERAAKLGWLTDQMGVLFDEQKRFRDDDWADIENIVQMKLLSDEDLITSFDRTVLSAITGYDTLTELMDAGELAWENMLAAGEEALQTWQDNCYAIYEEAGTTVDNFAAKTEEDMESVAEDSQNAKNAIYDMVNNEENGMKKALEDAKQAAKDFDDKYGKYMTSIQNATQATVNALNDMLKKLNETYQAQVKLAQQAAATAAAVAAANNASSGGGSSGGSGGGGGGSPSGVTQGSPTGPAASKGPETYYSFNKTGTDGNYPTLGQAESAGTLYGKHYIYLITKYDNGKIIAVLKKTLWPVSRTGYIAPGGGNVPRQALYDTGGYTGDWPTDSGRLAILHKKELVLNKDDTSNMLKVVGFVRRMTSQATAGLQSMFKNNINYNGINSIGSEELNQNVHIEASFPNVQSHTEIELALNNLINSATQYVNRK